MSADPVDPTLRREPCCFTLANPGHSTRPVGWLSRAQLLPGGHNDGTLWPTMEGASAAPRRCGGVAGRGWLYSSANCTSTPQSLPIYRQRATGETWQSLDIAALAAPSSVGIPKLRGPRLMTRSPKEARPLFVQSAEKAVEWRSLSSGKPAPSDPLLGRQRGRSCLTSAPPPTTVCRAAQVCGTKPRRWKRSWSASRVRVDRDPGTGDRAIEDPTSGPTRPKSAAATPKRPARPTPGITLYFHDGALRRSMKCFGYLKRQARPGPVQKTTSAPSSSTLQDAVAAAASASGHAVKRPVPTRPWLFGFGSMPAKTTTKDRFPLFPVSETQSGPVTIDDALRSNPLTLTGSPVSIAL